MSYADLELYKRDLFIKVDKKGKITEFEKFNDLLKSANDAKLLLKRVKKTEYGPDNWGNYFFTYDYEFFNKKGGTKKSFRLNGIKFSELHSEEDTRGSYQDWEFGGPSIYFTVYDSTGVIRKIFLKRIYDGNFYHDLRGKFNELFLNEINELSKALKDLKNWKLVNKYYEPLVDKTKKIIRLEGLIKMHEEFDKKHEDKIERFLNVNNLEDAFEEFK